MRYKDPAVAQAVADFQDTMARARAIEDRVLLAKPAACSKTDSTPELLPPAGGKLRNASSLLSPCELKAGR